MEFVTACGAKATTAHTFFEICPRLMVQDHINYLEEFKKYAKGLHLKSKLLQDHIANMPLEQCAF